ncbi:MAG TPA: c-type cytochrome [Verrucomicrobiae bacterium]|nr:c-type cytochrome [Verrucomicrobiae bacterium]
MKKPEYSSTFFTLAAAILLFAGGMNPGHAQESPAKPPLDKPKTAEQQFKNIQVLKGIPAEQLIPSMQFITASLGVECDFCHVEHAMDKDDKKTKLAARKMITMVLALNQAHFNGELEVTCYTCHRGAPHPVATPILSVEPATRPEHVHDDEDASQAGLPTPDHVLDKYLAAVGGADAVNKIKTRVQKGKIDAAGTQYPVEVYSEEPEKRVSMTHPSRGDSITAFNGEVGWLSMPNGFHRMTNAEAEAARIDAQLHFPVRLRELYKDFHVRPGEEIGGRQTVLVNAKASGRPDLRLYFDQENGLLLRQIRYAETPLGRNPTQIDYTDFRVADGVKIPYKWTLERPGGSFTIQIEQVQQNVPVDEKLFVMPSEKPGR